MSDEHFKFHKVV